MLLRFRISVRIWRHPGGRNGEEAECETEEEGGQAQSRARFPKRRGAQDEASRAAGRRQTPSEEGAASRQTGRTAPRARAKARSSSGWRRHRAHGSARADEQRLRADAARRTQVLTRASPRQPRMNAEVNRFGIRFCLSIFEALSSRAAPLAAVATLRVLNPTSASGFPCARYLIAPRCRPAGHAHRRPERVESGAPPSG
jgi:hypothetical protein